jgi:radical SAM superfamily enzyme YgiQ (UPF0313 family)
MPSTEEILHACVHRLRDYRLYRPNPSFGNPGWAESSMRVLILRLSPFADVERSTPHLFLAREARGACADAYIDMAFLPAEADARILSAAGLPLVIGTQSHRALGDFDLVLVSNSWLLEQANLPFLLTASGAPRWASERDHRWPPLILGGSNSSAAHALVSETGDCMADAVFFGEGEGIVGRMVASLRAHAGLPKRERVLRAASETPGLWPAGSLEVHVRKQVSPDDADPGTPGALLPGDEASTARLAITRGCPCRCTFCFEGYDRSPFRELPAEAVLQAARALKRATGADTLEIESFNFNTHAALDALLPGLHRLFHRVNLMSQRADILARTPGLIDLEIAADKHTFTLGIEGISQRLRRYLHKSLDEEDLRLALSELLSRPVRECKLFFLLTGRETEEDFEEFAGFALWLSEARSRARSAPRVVCSFGMLVRMPRTPLRHEPVVLDREQWRRLGGRAKSICETNGLEFRLSMSWPDYAATQSLARGGTGIHRLLERLADAGAVGVRQLAPEAARAVDEWIASNASALARELPADHVFPFPFIEDAGSAAELYRRYLDAKAGRDAGYCRRGEQSEEGCAECPGCTKSPRRDRAPTARRTGAASGVPSAAAVRGMQALMHEKRRLGPVYIEAFIPHNAAALGTRWAEAWLMRQLLLIEPSMIDNALTLSEVLVDRSGVLGDQASWFGRTVVAITAWDPIALQRALAAAKGAAAKGAAGNPFGAVQEHFVPDAWSSMRVRLELPDPPFIGAPDRLASYLRDAHAPVTLARADDGGHRMVIGEKSLKKRMLLEGSARKVAEGYRMDLLIGPKIDLGSWLSSFEEPGAARLCQAEIVPS